ncbi:hypothetical protein KR018_007781 [Drosophila ironensis]|nr:hypothetical protein KR018_007781 [Drosophila ironensis]
MNTKINFDTIYRTVAKLKRHSSEPPVGGFYENVELLIGLCNSNGPAAKRLGGNIQLYHIARPHLKVCVLGDARHCDEARSIGIDYLDLVALRALACDKKFAKKLAKVYDEFLISESLVKIVPRLLGPGLTNSGKFPTPLSHHESMQDKIDVISTTSLKIKNIVCLSVNVGNVGMNREKLTQNINMSIKFLVSLLKEKWSNVQSLHIKTIRGQPQRIY